MNAINTHARSIELEKLAAQVGDALPLYPTEDEINAVVREIMRLTGCTRNSARHAIVAGVLRVKRAAAKP